MSVSPQHEQSKSALEIYKLWKSRLSSEKTYVFSLKKWQGHDLLPVLQNCILTGLEQMFIRCQLSSPVELLIHDGDISEAVRKNINTTVAKPLKEFLPIKRQIRPADPLEGPFLDWMHEWNSKSSANSSEGEQLTLRFDGVLSRTPNLTRAIQSFWTLLLEIEALFVDRNNAESPKLNFAFNITAESGGTALLNLFRSNPAFLRDSFAERCLPPTTESEAAPHVSLATERIHQTVVLLTTKADGSTGYESLLEPLFIGKPDENQEPIIDRYTLFNVLLFNCITVKKQHRRIQKADLFPFLWKAVSGHPSTPFLFRLATSESWSQYKLLISLVKLLVNVATQQQRQEHEGNEPSSEWYAAVARKLLLDVEYSHNETLLHHAARRQWLDITEWLLSLDDFPVNHVNALNHTAFTVAKAYNNRFGVANMIEDSRGGSLDRGSTNLLSELPSDVIAYICHFAGNVHDSRDGPNTHVLSHLRLTCRALYNESLDDSFWEPIFHYRDLVMKKQSHYRDGYRSLYINTTICKYCWGRPKQQNTQQQRCVCNQYKQSRELRLAFYRLVAEKKVLHVKARSRTVILSKEEALSFGEMIKQQLSKSKSLTKARVSAAFHFLDIRTENEYNMIKKGYIYANWEYCSTIKQLDSVLAQFYHKNEPSTNHLLSLCCGSTALDEPNTSEERFPAFYLLNNRLSDLLAVMGMCDDFIFILSDEKIY